MWAQAVSTWVQIHQFLGDPAIQSICAIIALVVPVYTFLYGKLRKSRIYQLIIKGISFILNTIVFILMPLIEFNVIYFILTRSFIPLDQDWIILHISIVGMPILALCILRGPQLLDHFRYAYTHSRIGKILMRPVYLWRFRISNLEMKVIKSAPFIAALFSVFTVCHFSDTIGTLIGLFIILFILYLFISIFVISGINLFIRFYLHRDKSELLTQSVQKATKYSKRYIYLEDRERNKL